MVRAPEYLQYFYFPQHLGAFQVNAQGLTGWAGSVPLLKFLHEIRELQAHSHKRKPQYGLLRQQRMQDKHSRY